MAVPYIEYTGAATLFDGSGNPYGEPSDFVDPACGSEPPEGGFYVRRVTVRLPSGETHELRPDDTILFSAGQNNHTLQSNWNGIYYAVDGSNIRYTQNTSNNTYQLHMPDGSRYDFFGSVGAADDRRPIRLATKYTDRNGNRTEFYGPGSIDSDGVSHPHGYIRIPWVETFQRDSEFRPTRRLPTSLRSMRCQE